MEVRLPTDAEMALVPSMKTGDRIAIKASGQMVNLRADTRSFSIVISVLPVGVELTVRMSALQAANPPNQRAGDEHRTARCHRGALWIENNERRQTDQCSVA